MFSGGSKGYIRRKRVKLYTPRCIALRMVLSVRSLSSAFRNVPAETKIFDILKVLKVLKILILMFKYE